MQPRVQVLPDDHEATTRFFLDVLASRIELRGVVHVGAHLGQECPLYLERSLSQIVLIEANPAHCESLRATYGQNAGVDVIHAAITDADMPVTLFLNESRSGNDESSSLLQLKRLGEIVPTLKTKRSIVAPGMMLDTLLLGGRLDGCNFLNIDIQGAERQALRGAEQALHQFDAILVETNIIEMYEGCALEDEIDSVLASRGFRCIERINHELYEGDRTFPAWGESLYLRA